MPAIKSAMPLAEIMIFIIYSTRKSKGNKDAAIIEQ